MEFDHLGERCFLCNRQDYLPLECIKCKKYYCQIHIKQQDHNCKIKENKNKIKKKKSKGIKKKICSNTKCKESVILIKCKVCLKDVCISHRMLKDHSCVGSKKIKKQNTAFDIKEEKINPCLNCKII